MNPWFSRVDIFLSLHRFCHNFLFSLTDLFDLLVFDLDDILEGKGTFDTPEVDSSWIAVNQDEAGFPAAYDVKV